MIPSRRMARCLIRLIHLRALIHLSTIVLLVSVLGFLTPITHGVAQTAQLPPGALIWIRADHCSGDGSGCTNLSGAPRVTSASPSAEYRPTWNAARVGNQPALTFNPPANLVTADVNSLPFSAEYTITGVIETFENSAYGPSAWVSNDYAKRSGTLRHTSIAVYQSGLLVCQSWDLSAIPVQQDCFASPPLTRGAKMFTLRALANRRELWVNGQLVATQQSPTVPALMQLVANPQVLAEEALFAHALTDSEIHELHKYLGHRYSIPVAEIDFPIPSGANAWIRADQCAHDGSRCRNLAASGAEIIAAAPTEEHTPDWSPDHFGGQPALLATYPASLITREPAKQPFSSQYTVSGLIEITANNNVYGASAWISNDYSKRSGALRHASLSDYVQTLGFCQSWDLSATPLVQECFSSPSLPLGPISFTLRAFTDRRELWINGNLVRLAELTNGPRNSAIGHKPTCARRGDFLHSCA